jgi:hypothetical protein
MIRIKLAFARGMDALFSRWGNLAFTATLFVIFALVGYSHDPGFGRDFMWFTAGSQFGFAMFWLFYPRFTAARRREMETDMALMIAGAVHRANEAMGTDFEIGPPPDDAPPMERRHCRNMGVEDDVS